MTAPQELPHKPRADAFTVEDLVGEVCRGRIRVPDFQRPLKWGAQEVCDLFDSVYRGYPIGSLLFRQGPAPATRIVRGPLRIDAPERSDALWVVDGQQRITALACGLARPLPIPATPDDHWVVYFDARAQEFRAPPRDGSLDSSWVPLPELRDAAALSEWILSWQHVDDATLRKNVFDAAKRLREYGVPAYVVDASVPEEVLKEIFRRLNTFGKRLEMGEVFDALYGNEGPEPSTLGDLADGLDAVGMGRPDEEHQLLPALIAMRGQDVTQSLAEHYRNDPKILRNAVPEGLPVLRGALSFLRTECSIPHLRLLPRSTPLVVLSRFLAVHSNPKARSRELLARWVWRFLLGTASVDERTLRRRAVAAVDQDDEEASVQQILALVSSEAPPPFEVSNVFDARAASSRIVLTVLASLGPRHLRSGSPVDVAELIESDDVRAFRKIVSSGAAHSSPANRMIHPGDGIARGVVLAHIREYGPRTDVLASHAIDENAALALKNGDHDQFVVERARAIARAVDELGARLAEWGRSDRPSIAYLLNGGAQP